MRLSVFRRAHFNAAHRIHNPKWSDERNLEVFGACSNPHYHGHNYEVEVRVSGEVDPETGYVIDLGLLKGWIKSEIEDRFDHKNLNIEVAEFQKLIPTAEHICHVSWQLLRAKLPEQYDLHIRLYETPRNYVEYPAAE